LGSKKKNIDLLITLSAIFLIVAALVSLGLFFSTFSGGLSSDSQDWGAFGSYVSGTIGVTAASLAVIWLIRSVHIQKVELKYLKRELEKSSSEQEKQTHISALTAMVSTSLKMIDGYENSLRLVETSTNHQHPFADVGNLHIQIGEEQRKVEFYQDQIRQYVQNKYENQAREDKDEDY